MEGELTKREPSTARPPQAEGQEGDQPRQQLPGLVHNRVSLTGAIIAGFTVANMLSFMFATVLGMRPNPYFGIFVYLVFPAIALIGLMLIPLGMMLERRRRRRLLPGVPAYPQLDLNKPAVRRGLLGALGFSLLFVTVSAGASYHAYQFTESASFCGLTCHVPMKPEFTAYQHSPHAQVACADCHVGSGATWFLRSKFSGTGQLYAVLFAKYPRPIANPIKNLRPVRAACEECHWPEKFYDSQYKTFTHFALDEKNTPRHVQMLIKTGGGGAEFGKPTGIHWHMNIANKVWFVATDKQEQVIPWVKVRNGNGRTVEYLDKSGPLTAKQVETMPKEMMDCVTCHNRPSHRFRPPVQAVDYAFEAGKLDPSLPYLKKQAVTTLTRGYGSLDLAIEGIATALDTYYRSRYPAIYAEKQPQIKTAIAALQAIYENNIFPYMKVDWRTYPDNIGHLNYPGCFRCHDGNHVSADGQVISNDCDSCHTILGPYNPEPSKGGGQSVKGGGQSVAIAPVKFQHPKELERQNNCDSCHTGARL